MTRKTFVLIGGAMVGVLLLMAFFLAQGRDSAVWSSVMAKTDSGIAECQKMAERVKATTSPNSKEGMTEADYKKALEPFEQSSYEDLKTAGTQFVNTVWKAQQVIDDENSTLEDSFGTLVLLKTSHGALKIACRNHGVVLPDLAV